MTTIIQNGYGCLLAALNEAHGAGGGRVNNSVTVTVGGKNPRSWNLVTGDHLERDGRIHLGQTVIVNPDSTVLDGGKALFEGGHLDPNGDRMVHFTFGGIKVILEWNDPDQVSNAA